MSIYTVKRLLCLLLALVLCAPFAACGAETGGDSSVSEAESSECSLEEDSSAESVASEQSSAEASSEEESSAVAVTDPGMPRNQCDEVYTADSIDSYFDGSVFIGYSIMMHFGRYINEWRSEIDGSYFGTARFCAGVGMSFRKDESATPDSEGAEGLPMYQGKAYNFADLPAATGCDTLYIGLMGFGDLRYPNDKSNCARNGYQCTKRGIIRIREKNPDLNIVILSSTYHTGDSDSQKHIEKGITNENIRKYNNMVLEYCNEVGIDFIDVSTCLTTYGGNLVKAYTTDGSYHIQKCAYDLWVDILRDYARAKTEGAWENLSEMPPLVHPDLEKE